jgi:hypothetical protein
MMLAVEPLEDRRVLSLGLGSLPSAAATSLVSLQLPNLVAPVIVTTQPSVVTPNTGTGSATVVSTPATNAGPSITTLATALLENVLPTLAPLVNTLPANPTIVSGPTLTVTPPVNSLLTAPTNTLAPLLQSLTVTPVTTSIPLPLNIGPGSTLNLLGGLLPTLGNTLTPLLGTVTNALPLMNSLTGTLVGTGNPGAGGLLGGLLGGVLSPLLSTLNNSVVPLLNNLPLLSSLGIGIGLSAGNGNPTTLSLTLPLLSVNLALAPLPVPAVTAIVGINAGPSNSPGAPLPPITVTVSGNAGTGDQGGGASVTVTIGPAGSDGHASLLLPGDGGTTHTGNSADSGGSLVPVGNELADVVTTKAPDSAPASDAGTALRDTNAAIKATQTGAVSHEELGLFFSGQGDEEEQPAANLGANESLSDQAVLTTLFTTPEAFNGVIGTEVMPATQTTTAISSAVLGPSGAAAPAAKEQAEPLVFIADGERLADGTGFNLVTLEQEVQQLLSQLNNLHHDLTDLMATFGLSPWMFGLAVAAVVGLEGRRRFRRRKMTLAQALAGDDAALPWFLHCERMVAAENS